MKKTVIVLICISLISKIMGFFRDIILAYFYGASSISDVYLISLTIPGVIFSFIVVGITTAYIPLFTKVEKQIGEDGANKFTNNLISIVFILCTIICFFIFIYTEQIVKVFAMGFEGETLELAIRFTKITIIGIYFTVLIQIYSSYLQIKQSFTIPGLIGIPFNIIMLISIYLSNTNIMLLAIGYVLATASQLMLLLPFVYKFNFNYKPFFDLKDKYIKEIGLLAFPVILGTATFQINKLVDRTLASNISNGGISALNYATTLKSFLLGIIISAIVAVLYPMIAKMASEKNINGLKKSITEVVTGINLIVIPVTIGSMIFAEPIVRVLFGRGVFDFEAISMTSTTLFYYSIGMIGFGLREILSRVFYSLEDTKTPMINAAIAMVMNVILNIILSKYMGIGGLALATSISVIFCTLLLFISLRSKIGSLGMKKMSISFLKILLASVIMGFIAKFSYESLLAIMGTNMALLIAILMSATFYFLIVYFIRIKEFDLIVISIKEKMKKLSLKFGR